MRIHVLDNFWKFLICCCHYNHYCFFSILSFTISITPIIGWNVSICIPHISYLYFYILHPFFKSPQVLYFWRITYLCLRAQEAFLLRCPFCSSVTILRDFFSVSTRQIFIFMIDHMCIYSDFSEHLLKTIQLIYWIPIMFSICTQYYNDYKINQFSYSEKNPIPWL